MERRSVLRFALGVAATLAVALVALAGNVYGGDPSSVKHVTVHRGDSLWSIAVANYGDGDVRGEIDTIIRINHLGGGGISPGQDLIVPAS